MQGSGPGRVWTGAGWPWPGAAAILAAVLAAPVLDAFGIPRSWILALVLVVTAAALLSAHGERDAAGQEPPAISNGMGMAACCLSPALVTGVLGAVFANGHDGLVYIPSVAGGLFLALLLANPIARSGAASIPDGLSRKLGDQAPGRAAAILLTLCCLLVAAADLTAIGLVGSALTGLPFAAIVASSAVVAVLAALLAASGRRSVSSVLVYLLVLLAVTVPLISISHERLGFPALQMGMGGAVSDVLALEQNLIRRGLAEARSLKPLLTPLVSLSAANTLGIAVALSLGMAILPFVLSRPAMRSSSASTRRQIAWTLIFFTLAASALPALAVVARLEVLGLVGQGTRLDALPAWIYALGQSGGMKICGAAALDAETVMAACKKVSRHPGLLRLQDLAVDPDALLAALPNIIKLTFLTTAVLAAGILSAALFALQTTTGAAARLICGEQTGAAAPPWMLPATAALSAALALLKPADPLTMLVWAASIAASTVLPAVALASWRRLTSAGALAGMASGILACAAYVIGTRYFAVSFHSVFSGFADVAPAAQRRFVDLHQVWSSHSAGPAKDVAWIALDLHAQRIAGIWGLRSTSVVLIALPLALSTMLVSGLIFRKPRA